MKIYKKFFEKLADVLIRLGEASLVAGIAAFFLKDLPRALSLISATVGLLLIVFGLRLLYFSEEKGT